MELKPRKIDTEQMLPGAGAGSLVGSPGPADGADKSEGKSDRYAARRLAEMFAREPELILAFLEGRGERDSGHARLLLSAASLALNKHPDHADLNYYAAHAALAAGETGKGAELLERALRINPRYADARMLAARVALLNNQPQAACRHLATALSNGADYPDLHMLLGKAWEAQGQRARARASYERALRLNAGLAPAREALVAAAGAACVRAHRRCERQEQ